MRFAAYAMRSHRLPTDYWAAMETAVPSQQTASQGIMGALTWGYNV